ncbi:alpha/beta hydrolase family protein [Uliginosibacterium sp. H1]|uniref:alpha/beta hydrolase family protein n=1 Tax=Uliginosibacterium sp. H1 TaxID=3114757 RepID=UPI002E197551|nr:dienelactone hydrolase family protein [Uliginosibacterium sp. H1]
MRACLKLSFLFALLICLLPGLPSGPVARAQAATLDHALREEVWHLPVRARDIKGREIAGDIPVTVFRPQGDGPFPLVVISHGRAGSRDGRARPARQRFESAASYFVRKGFAVAVPTRLGYGETITAGDPEDRGAGCSNNDYSALVEASGAQVQAVVARMRQEAWADPQRLLLVGQSVGGIATISATSRGIAGLVAAVNFAGGSGGSPERHPGKPCAPQNMDREIARLARSANAPMLWLYTENDQYFDPATTRAWHATYQANGGRAEYRLLPPFSDDGHKLFAQGNAVWQPILDVWLAESGLGPSSHSSHSTPSRGP